MSNSFLPVLVTLILLLTTATLAMSDNDYHSVYIMREELCAITPQKGPLLKCDVISAGKPEPQADVNCGQKVCQCTYASPLFEQSCVYNGTFSFRRICTGYEKNCTLTSKAWRKIFFSAGATFTYFDHMTGHVTFSNFSSCTQVVSPNFWTEVDQYVHGLNWEASPTAHGPVTTPPETASSSPEQNTREPKKSQYRAGGPVPRITFHAQTLPKDVRPLQLTGPQSTGDRTRPAAATVI
eukprot:sb/3469160/